jgi:hypothetical protein
MEQGQPAIAVRGVGRFQGQRRSRHRRSHPRG